MGVGALGVRVRSVRCRGGGRLFHLAQRSRGAILALNASGCVRASLVVLREWAGPAAAHAAGAASVTDERAMLVFVPWGVLLAEDAFVAYERMLRGYGDSVVAYAPVRGNGCSRLPVVAVEAAAWALSGAGRRLCVRGRYRGVARGAGGFWRRRRGAVARGHYFSEEVRSRSTSTGTA